MGQLKIVNFIYFKDQKILKEKKFISKNLSKQLISSFFYWAKVTYEKSNRCKLNEMGLCLPKFGMAKFVSINIITMVK